VISITPTTRDAFTLQFAELIVAQSFTRANRTSRAFVRERSANVIDMIIPLFEHGHVELTVCVRIGQLKDLCATTGLTLPPAKTGVWNPFPSFFEGLTQIEASETKLARSYGYLPLSLQTMQLKYQKRVDFGLPFLDRISSLEGALVFAQQFELSEGHFLHRLPVGYALPGDRLSAEAGLQRLADFVSEVSLISIRDMIMRTSAQ